MRAPPNARVTPPFQEKKRGKSSLFAPFGGIFWLKDESLGDSVNLVGLSSLPGFPRHTRSLGASRRKVAAAFLRAANARPRHYRAGNCRRSTSSSRPVRQLLGNWFREGLAADSRIETRSLPTFTRSYPRRFTFYVAHPIRSIRAPAHYEEDGQTEKKVRR